MTSHPIDHDELRELRENIKNINRIAIAQMDRKAVVNILEPNEDAIMTLLEEVADR